MNEREWLAGRFEEHRPHLNGIAFRLLGSATEADDAVQEAWLRLNRTTAEEIDNLGGWLTTVVGRVCLDMLRSRRSRREETLDPEAEPIKQRAGSEADPEQEAVLADSVSLALLVVLEKLAPAERVAFVLHDVFDVPFDEIAPIVGRSSTAARQLASRGRRRVQGTSETLPSDLARQQEVVRAFMKASREGDFDALLALLDPNVILRSDVVAVQAALPPEIVGADAVARAFVGRARGTRPALIDGAVGFAWAPGGKPQGVFALSITDGRISAIDIITDAEDLAHLDVTLLKA